MRSSARERRQRGRSRILAGISVAAILAAAFAVAAPAYAISFDSWQISSSPMDGSPGTSESFAPPITDLVLSGTAASVQVDAVQPGWQATFQAPAGEALVAGRFYPFVVRATAGGASRPGLLVARPGQACTTVMGTFRIYDIAVDPDSGVPTRFGAEYSEFCDVEGIRRTGEIRVNLANPAAARTIMAFSTVPHSPLPMSTIKLNGQLRHGAVGLDGYLVNVTRHDASGDVTTGVVTSGGGWFNVFEDIGVDDVTFTADYAGDADHLPGNQQIIVKAVKAPSQLHLAGPASSAPQAPVTLTGTLADAAGPIWDGEIQITGESGGTTTNSTVWTDRWGNYSLSMPVGTSATTFTANYVGDPGRLVAQDSATVAVVRPPPYLELFGPVAADRGASISLSGGLAYGSEGAYESVVLTRTDLAGATTSLVQTNSTGGFSVTDVPTVGGEVTYTVSWPGNVLFAPAEKTVTVDVSRLASELSIHASASTYAYGADARVLAHLGTTYNGRYVSLYAQPLGTTATPPGTLIAKGRVNSNGDIAAYYAMTRKTTFTAVFAGDYRYAPASAAVTPTVSSRVSLTPSGYAGKSGSYYHYRTTNPSAIVGVSPLRTSGCTSVTVERYSAGVWTTKTTVPCAVLDATSHAAFTFTASRSVGTHYRMRGQVGSGTYGAAGTSAWVYFLFV